MFFLIAVLVACVSAQSCSVEGNTYTNGASSVTFGKFVGSWLPAIINDGSASGVAFGSWVVVSSNRWTFTEWFSSGNSLVCGADKPQGSYNISLSADCGTLTFRQPVDAQCSRRSTLLSGSGSAGNAFVLNAAPLCGREGNDISGTFHASDAKPALSEKPVHLTFANNGYTIVSVSTDYSILQRWIYSGSQIQVTDLFSFPDGAACESSVVGTYNAQITATTCATQVCGVSDKCLARAQLWHTARFQGFTGEVCPPFSDTEEGDIFGECSDGTQWNEHPYACIDQPVTGGCAFCGGRVQGRDIDICVKRNGVACQTIYEQVGTKQYCNLAFECGPASVLSASFILLISCLVALF